MYAKIKYECKKRQGGPEARKDRIEERRTLGYWQEAFLLIFVLINLAIFARGFYECKYKKNAYGPTYLLLPLGIFVWGDAIVFGLFWVGIALACYFLHDWILFLLIFSLFWVVRSVGETIYYFNQQFSKVIRQPPKKLIGYSIFQNDSIWFIYQTFCQCLTIISLVFAVYYASLWLQ
jgi:hypothetical protein